MKNAMRWLTIGLLAWALGGCAAAVVGGAAAGGYYVGKDERSAGEITDDALTTGQIKTAFARDDMVPALDINVDTYRSVVTLHGSVRSRAVVDRAIRLAKSIKGVRRVVSRLAVVH